VSDGNDAGNEDPPRGDAAENATMPQGEPHTDDQNEISDQKKMNKSHDTHLTGLLTRRQPVGRLVPEPRDAIAV
jgi:hypothetical protein